MIVADAGFKHNDAAAAFAEFGGIPAGLDAYGAESVGEKCRRSCPLEGWVTLSPSSATAVRRPAIQRRAAGRRDRERLSE